MVGGVHTCTFESCLNQHIFSMEKELSSGVVALSLRLMCMCVCVHRVLSTGGGKLPP